MKDFQNQTTLFLSRIVLLQNTKMFKKLKRSIQKNIKIIKGFFQDTLTSNKVLHDSKFKFVHIDCDLYISAHEPLIFISTRLVSGAYIMIDDFTNLDKNNKTIRDAFYNIFDVAHIEKVGFFGIDGVVFRYLP